MIDSEFTIEPLELPFVLLSELQHLPKVPGVYLAIDAAGTVLYVGQSANMHGRWLNHHISKQLSAFTSLETARTVRLAWIEESDETRRLALETVLIDRFSPALNTGYPCRSALVAVERSSDAMTFGAWITERLRALRISQSELAGRMGVSKSYISMLVSDKPNPTTGRPILPSIEKVDAIAAALNMPIAEARRAAGYASRSQVTALQARLEAALEKCAQLGERDQEVINALIEMLEREILRRLPTSLEGQ